MAASVKVFLHELHWQIASMWSGGADAKDREGPARSKPYGCMYYSGVDLCGLLAGGMTMDHGRGGFLLRVTEHAGGGSEEPSSCRWCCARSRGWWPLPIHDQGKP